MLVDDFREMLLSTDDMRTGTGGVPTLLMRVFITSVKRLIRSAVSALGTLGRLRLGFIGDEVRLISVDEASWDWLTS